MNTYTIQMLDLINEACEGIHTYAVQLEDLSGYVLDPIYEMRMLTERANPFPEGLDRDLVFTLLRKAIDGAEKYGLDLSDTTDCTQYLDQLAVHLREND